MNGNVKTFEEKKPKFSEKRQEREWEQKGRMDKNMNLMLFNLFSFCFPDFFSKFAARSFGRENI